MSDSNWVSDTKRRDGVYVHKLATENWAIRREGKSITACPCCNSPLRTLRTARLVADEFYPMVSVN